MNFPQLLRYVKEKGCRVRVYKGKKLIDGSAGTFEETDCGPIISLAFLDTPPQKQIELLLHEFGHFLQWKDGYMATLDGICNAYEIFPRWIKHQIELTPLELQVARNTNLSLEWNAETRALELAKELSIVDFDPQWYLKGACAYMLSIKWAWANRKNFHKTIKREFVTPHHLTPAQLFSPLSAEEKEILKNYEG